MSDNLSLEEFYEVLDSDMRKLDELIAQLELWSDINTINHKKEQIRLEEYLALSENLYEQEKAIKLALEEGLNQDEAGQYEEKLHTKMETYKETERIIHNWIREIKELQPMIMKSQVLYGYKEELEAIAAGTK